MQKMLDFLFTEEQALSARTLIVSGIIAYGLSFLLPIFGGILWGVLLAIMVLAVALLCYAALREIVPLMDPRDPDADRFVVWGTLLIFLAIGWTGFGLFFVPGLILGLVLLWWRLPEVMEIVPFLEKPGDTGLRR